LDKIAKELSGMDKTHYEFLYRMNKKTNILGDTNMKHIRYVLVVIITAAALCRCATYPISEKYRQEANLKLDLATVLKNPQNYVGTTIIWGGIIINTINNQGSTDLVILETPLMNQEYPDGRTNSQGRFIATSNQFFDPAIYRKGKKVTVAGKIQGQQSKPLGNMNYNYPVIQIEQIFLWQRNPYQYYAPYEPYGYYDPFWPYYEPFGPYYEPFFPDRREHDGFGNEEGERQHGDEEHHERPDEGREGGEHK
jgi:outer membrane lipoprotein